jgi:hypothetical protein
MPLHPFCPDGHPPALSGCFTLEGRRGCGTPRRHPLISRFSPHKLCGFALPHSREPPPRQLRRGLAQSVRCPPIKDVISTASFGPHLLACHSCCMKNPAQPTGQPGEKCPGSADRRTAAAATAFSSNGAYSSTGSKSSLPAPQIGQTQSSGISSKAVPGSTPPSGSPTAGSYT